MVAEITASFKTKNLGRILFFAIGGLLVGFGYSIVLIFFAVPYAGAGHGTSVPIQALSEPFGIGLSLWPILFALLALSEYRCLSAIGIAILLFYYWELWMHDVLGDVRRLNVSLASVFEFVFTAHLVTTANVLLFFTYRFLRAFRDTSSLSPIRQNPDLNRDSER